MRKDQFSCLTCLGSALFFLFWSFHTSNEVFAWILFIIAIVQYWQANKYCVRADAEHWD